MRYFYILIVMCSFIFTRVSMTQAEVQKNVYALSAQSIDGEDVSLASFQGKVLLIVNVASQCGFTPQYEGLQKLYETYTNQGLEILGFPSNDFGGQEPGTDSEIKQFCTKKFGVSFPMFSKIQTKGSNAHPLYQLLIQSTGGAAVGWNFEKFLVGRDGLVVDRFDSSTRPLSAELTSAIENALGKGS